MQATFLTWFILGLGTVLAELQCEWEYKDKAYLSGWAPGIPSRTKYPTLEEAQKVCKTLGDNCGGITLWSGGYTCREGKEFVAHSSEQSWRKSCMGVPLFRVSSITPNKGSRVGGSRITISGQGFSTNQFGYDDPSLGNKVTFYHKDEVHPAVQCIVQTYYTSSTRIVCDMAKPDVYWGDWLEYRIRISVDGTWMDSTGTNIYCGGACTYWFHKDNTPYISSVGTRHVPAGSVLTMTGRMWTDNFEPSTDVSSDSDHIKRVFLNSFTCDPSDENGNSYGTDLQVDDNGEDTSIGSIKCKSKSPGATSYRPSFLHSKWGRSETRANINRVDSQMQKYAIQSYNELKTVSPTEGSKNGGTKITITSEHVIGPESNIKVDVGGSDCKVESYTADKIVCSTPASEDKTVYPGNRGVMVEYWSKETDKSTNDARGLDVDLIRAFTQDADNFLFEKLHLDSKPDTLKQITGNDKDEPYYVRLKFFISIQETDQYGFHMISDHSGKLYVSTDDNPANVVLRANCTSRHDNWNKLQTDVDVTLEAGKIYYVEFVGVMWNYGQDFGVGLTKKTTPYQNYDVDISRKEYPYWYWKQDYSDEIQVIDLGGLIKSPQTGFKLQIGDRETTTLYASSTAEQISDAIIDTAVYKCPTLDAADSWYSVDFENGDMSYTGGWSRNTIEPYCGRWVAINTWAIFHVKYEKKVYEWDLSKGYKHLCFALKTAQPRVSLYYELDYEDANFRWQRQGFWRGQSQEETPELQDNDGTWKYNCIDFEKRVKEIDNSLWENRIGNRKWKVRRVELGWQHENGWKRNTGACRKWMQLMPDGACIYTDAIRILRSDITEGSQSNRKKRLVVEENSRVKGFALDGPGLLEAATIQITDYCDDDEDCTTERTDEAVKRKWKINMKTYGCGYNFPLIGIVGKTATVVTKNMETKYTVGGKTVHIKREAAITPDLQGTFDVTIDGTTHSNIDVHIQERDFLKLINKNGEYSSAEKKGNCYGTFDLTIDGHKYEKIDVHIAQAELLTLVRNNGDYKQAHKWGSCYERHWRLERRYSGHHGWHSVDSTNVVGVGEVKTYVMYRDNERGGLVMTPLYGDWIRTAHSKPQVAVKVGGIQAFCNGTCDYTPSDALTPTVTSLSPTSGGTGSSITLTGTGFGTTSSAVTVALGGAAQTVTGVTDTTVTVTLGDAVAKAHPATDIVVNVAGKGNAKVTDSLTLTYTGAASAITPITGSVGGGTVVTITGSGFDPNNAGVNFNGNSGKVISATYQEIKAIAPAGTAGLAPIVITGGTGFVAPDTALLQYTYSATGVPTVSQISPGSGSVVGNTKVTITGTNLADIKEAKIGDVVCAKDTEQTSTDTKYYCITGPNSPARHLVTMVTTSGELAQSTTKFYHKLQVQDVSPLQGSVVGGTEVTITGSGFGTNKTLLNVEFGDLECHVTSVTDTVIKCDTEAAESVDQLWSDYTSTPTCVESKATGYKKTAQDVHNMYRRRHVDTPDICFSSEVAKTADYWANYLVEKNVFKSSTSSNREGRGENLMMFEHWDLKSDEAYMRDAISAWYSEGSKYNADEPSNALRYTQMLWTLSDEVGCSIAKSTPSSSTEKYKIYVVCHYAPAGNTEGKFDTYVKKFDTAHHRTTAALSSRSVAVNVFLDTRKATVSKSSASPSGDCTPLTGTVSGCSDSAPAAATGDFSYAYYSCSTPLITNVTRQLFWDQTINIDGKGFGSTACAVQVKLGSDHVCTVTSVTDKKIRCKVDLASEPPVYTLFEAKVTILGRGSAVFSGENHDLYAYSSIQPKITSIISPNQGSLKGGVSVVLTGGGFKYNTGEDVTPISGSVSDGVTDFEILSATYKTITVRSRTGIPDEVDTPKDLTLTQDQAPVECEACTFTYKVGKTPTVTNVTKTAKDPGPGYTVTITGTLLCPGQTGTTISIGDSACVPTSGGCTNTQITCEIGDMPSGTYTVSISTTNGNPKYDAGMNTLTFVYAITSVQPKSGSVHGGTDITITGTGLPATDSLNVATSKYTLTIISKTTSQIIARTPDRKITDQLNNQIRFNGKYIEHMYMYQTSKSPIISDISPASGTYDTELTITGERFLNQDNETSKTSVIIGEDKSCVITTVTLTEIKCKLPHAAAGEYSIIVKVDPYGDSNLEKKINYTMSLGVTDPASPTTGTLGGPTIALQGSGFPHGEADPSLHVTVCGVDVQAELVSNSLLNIPLPACPDNVCTTDSYTCDIVVRRFNTSLTKTGAVTYNKGDTPSISNIDPADAGTGGGKTITITGTGFSDVTSDVSVKFDGVACTVLTTSTTQITCKTGAKADKANKDGVEVRIKKSLALNPAQKTMTYMDKWSSKFTWGGDLANKPVEGDLAVLTEGQIIYLDESPPKLRALLLRGGHLVFDDNQDLILKADYILILGGGSITIGTEETPFQHEAIIEMYGNQQSTELPMYGAKTLAVRNGTVEMHGKEVTPKWTELGETAEAGATSIVINTETNWKVSDQIALSSSSFAPEENEEFIITSINYDSSTGKTTLGLNNPLKYKHISLEQTINGLKIKTAAKVGHLTRNVKMRGNVNEDHLEMIDACPQTFDPDQFATQTCYQGRYGAMMDSDQFGSQIMFHAAAMETREVHGRLENAEFSWAGQAFRLGRYPIHFHMNGDVSGSYVKGCAIHHTFNRAVTVHGVNNLLVKDNVAFNNLGHAYFLEDGVEEDNVFDGNLAIFTQSSSSLLNVDVTPASFWIVNPRNTFINNVAAGSTHFGFWFNMPLHPGGPSATNEICPRNMGMKEFRGNEAHSCGRYGIWVWEFWHPRGNGSCEATTPNMTTLHDFHGWHNLRGVEVEDGDGIAMDNFVLHDNWFSQMEVHKCKGSTFEEGNTRMTNSQIISKTKSSDGMKMLYMNEEFQCGTGVVVPGKGMFSVHDSTMHDFTQCPVFEACGGCKDRQGGFISEFKGIKYINSPIKAKFQWEFEVIMRDIDGSLSETGKPNSIITPNMAILDKTSCSKSDAWSHGVVEGAVCDDKTNLVRLGWNNPSIQELLFKSVFLTNSHGNVSVPWFFKRMTHMQGWMATVPTGNTYTMKWDTELKFTNASYKMTAYYPKDGDYIILEQNLNDKPDYITVGGSSNKKLEPIDGATDDPGTFTFDDESKKLSHLITGKGIDTTKELPMDLKVYKCFYENCTDPHPKPLPANPTLLQRPETPKRWSVSSDWMGTEEGLGGYNGILPKAGDKVVIPSSWWMIYDATMEGLGDIMVYGVLEFSNEKDTVLGANRIVVVGGKLVVGWADEPLRVKAHIKLTGSREDKEYTLNDGTTIGSKAIGIVGYTEMHSVVPDVLATTLSVKASKGATTITVKDNVADKWKVGDEIAIASTSFVPDQAEKRKITKVDGHILTLDQALEFDHDYLLQTIHEHTYERTAEVGLLTRLITIEGVMDPADTTLYGGRVLVSDYSQVNDEGEREEYIPVAQIMGVQFKNCGQRGYRDYWDPRYALALQNTQPGQDSYVKSCAVDVSHNHAIGIIGSHNVEVSGNVVYHSRGSGILSNSENTEIVGNTVIYVRSYANWETPVENDNYFMDACVETYETKTASLKDNRCGGSERVGFSTQGEELSGDFWQNNVAHSCLWGIFVRKSKHEVVKLNNVILWQNYDYGVAHFSTSSLVIQNSVLADNGFSIFNMVVGPNALDHTLENKYVEYKNTLIYGRRDDSKCDERKTDRNPTSRLTGIGYHSPPAGKGGRVGMYLSNFIGSFPGWPKFSIASPMDYSSIKGITTLSGVTFANFGRCNDVVISDNRANGDCFHPVKMTGMKYSGVDMEANLLHMNNPSIGFVNSADCVDMPCDAKKKVLITDLDGTTLGKAGDSLTSRSEFQWDGDQKWGMGDYRLPNQMTTALNGSFIKPSTWPNKGIDRVLNGNTACEYKENYNMYKCSGVTYKMMVIESMDGDTELRRLSPLALATDDGSVDLINGPMDHGWCGGYTCQQRISTFYALVIVGKEYKLYLTSTQPQSMRYMLLDAAAGDKIKLDIWYSKSQRLDVYYKGKYKAPTNAQKKNDGTYSYATDKTAEELYPKLSSAAGTNFFDSKAHWMSMLIKGPDPFTIKTSPKIVLSLTLESVDGSNFFDEDKIIDNLAALLGVPKNKIKIAKIVAEGRRKRSGQEFEIEISEPAIEDEASMDVTKVTEMATALTKASETFVETVQKGELGKVLEAEVRSVSVQLPEIPPADQRNMTVDPEEAAKQTGETYAEKKAKEEENKAENAESIAVLIPNSLKLVEASNKVAVLSNLALRSKVVTSDDRIVPLLGAGEKKWKASVELLEGPTNGRILGTKQVTFANGYGNLTDIRVSRKGQYKFKVAVTYPENLGHEIGDITVEITEQDKDSPYKRVIFKFDGDYDEFVGDKSDEFTAYMKSLLKTKFPNYQFDDIDHYKGSVTVETTVSTSSQNKDDTSAAVSKIAEDTKEGFDIEFNGRTARMAEFTGDADSSGGSNTAAIVVPIVIVVLLAGLAGGGFIYYKKKQNRVSESITMSKVKNVDSDPSLTRQKEGSNIYSNQVVNVDVACESQPGQQGQVANEPLAKIAAIHKALQALNRLESAVNDPRYNPMVDEELDEICVESRPGTADQDILPGSGGQESRAELEVPVTEDQNSRDGLIDPDTPGTSDSEGNWRERHNAITECVSCKEVKKTWPCPICSGPRYCSKPCLDKDWPEHHVHCRSRSRNAQRDISDDQSF